MAFLDSNDQSIQVAVNSTADNKGIDEATKGLDSLNGTAKEVSDSSKNLSESWKSNLNKVAVATAAVGAGLTIYAKQATDFAVDYVKDSKALARITGDTAEDASKLIAVGRRLGIDSSQLGVTFGVLSKKINEAGNSTDSNRIAAEKLQINIKSVTRDIQDNADAIKKNGDVNGDLALKNEALQNKLAGLKDQLTKTANPLDQLNIKVKNADGSAKAFNSILLEVADRFKTMPDGAGKTAVAMDLFGRSGKDMIKILNLGSDGIKDLEDKAEKLGLTLSTKNIAQVNDYVKSQKELKDSTDQLKLAVGLATTPVLTSFHQTLNDVITSLIGMDGPAKTATVDILAFGGPVLGGVSALASFGANSLDVINYLKTMDLTLAGFAGFGIITGMAVAAAGAIYLVVDAFIAMNNATKAWDKADAAIISAGNSQDASIRHLQDLAKNGTPEQKSRALNTLHGLAGRAGGGPVSAGQLYRVNERGEEYFMPQVAGRIVPANKTTNQSSTTIQNVHLYTAEAADRFFDKLDRRQLLTSMGLSPGLSGAN